jgi:hypothetical protein
MKMIKLAADEWKRILEEVKGPTGKITAIKSVRQARLHRVVNEAGEYRSNINLLEAKEAVEFQMDAMGLRNPDGSRIWSGAKDPIARMAPFQPIRRVVCDFGSGEVEMDMESVSLRILSSVNEIPISEFTALLELYKRIKGWEEEQSMGGAE